MSQDFDTWMRHGIQIRTGVFLNRSTLVILCMHTCNRIIQFSEQFNRLDPDARQYPGYLIPLQKAIQFQNAFRA